MHIAIISGSHRHNGTYKAALYIQARLEATGCTTDLISLHDENLPLRSPDRRNKESDISMHTLSPLRERLIKADGFVIASPERAGMVSPALKNFFLVSSSKNEFAHKAALIVGVSSGTGGSYPVAELRMSSYKNTKITYIPDHVIIRDIDNVLSEHALESGSENDVRIKSRIERSLDILKEYATALTNMRKNTKVNLSEHAYGM